jgi:hypothetical protein
MYNEKQKVEGVQTLKHQFGNRVIIKEDQKTLKDETAS